jgi:hypothetical protein
MIVYHGGYCIIENPEIRISRNKKDFGHGFYCTELQTQSERWAKRFDTPIVSVYEYTEIADIDILRFETMTEEWLDFIVDCRNGKPHNHDIVMGSMANDQVWRFINNFINGTITRDVFWMLAKFRHPTQQIAFCSEPSLLCVKYIKSYEVQK